MADHEKLGTAVRVHRHRRGERQPTGKRGYDVVLVARGIDTLNVFAGRLRE